jgi:poly(ADP-ribose) glycohydrolase
VLFKLPVNNHKLEPYVKEDIWDGDHVRMPNSRMSLYNEINEHGVQDLKKRWELIELSLLIDFENSYQLETAIKKYNSRYEQLWDFSSFHHLIQTELNQDQRSFFLKNLLPNIVKLALSINVIVQCPISLLKQGMNHSISMTQEQAACLLANAFLCTFPRRNTEKRNSEFSNYPEINFNRLFGSDAQKSREKLKCIFNYFKRVFEDRSSLQKGVITFQRRSIKQFPDWKNDSRKLSDIKFQVTASETIETAEGCLQVDFANKFVGGGVLGGGSVQEEIRFVVNPELIVAKLFSECLDDGEALIITGTEQFNQYQGYASSFQFAGNFYDTTPRDDCNRRKTRIVAIDALSYRNYYEQFKEENLKRDINKAFVGFANNDDIDLQPVATGLWGAGAFHGHPIRSAIIQFMACRASRRNLIFSTFGDEVMEFQVFDIFQFLSMNNVTIGEVYEILKKFRYSEKTKNVEDLVPFIKKRVIADAKNINQPKFFPSTSNSDQNQQQSSGFKQKSLFDFKIAKNKPPDSHQPAKEKSEKDVPMPRFNDTKFIKDDKERFDAIEANFKELKKPIPIFKPIQSRSLLDSLNDDFEKK